jgi:predicted ArsR family transcriptional regulator
MMGEQENSVGPVKVERKEQGATRQNILQYLRRRGQMTAIELSESLEIGAVGIRQHLALLERDGLVEIAGLRRSVGRPSHLYQLTPEAERYFPKSYDTFAVEILDIVADTYGKDAVNRIFSERREKIKNHCEARMQGKSRAGKVAELASILVEMGHMCEYEQDQNGAFVLIGHNCPLDCIARYYPQCCIHDKELYQELLGVSIKRETNIASGDLSCRYVIPPDGEERAA